MKHRHLVKINSHPNLAKDTRSGAIINISTKSFLEAKERYAARKKHLTRLHALEERLNILEALVTGKHK